MNGPLHAGEPGGNRCLAWIKIHATAIKIFEQTEQTYDAASNVIQTISHARYHSATGTGSLGTPTNTQPKARVTYVATYPDALGRTVAMPDYGTNAGTALSRLATIPARSDNCLVTSMSFDAAGNPASTTDPAVKVGATRDLGVAMQTRLAAA